MTYLSGANVYISTEWTGSGLTTGSSDAVAATAWLKTKDMKDYLISPLACNGDGAQPAWNKATLGNEAVGTCSATPLTTVGGVEFDVAEETEVIDLQGQSTKATVVLDDNEVNVTIPILEDTAFPWMNVFKSCKAGITGSPGSLCNDAHNVTYQSGYRIYVGADDGSATAGTGSGCHWMTFKHGVLTDVEYSLASPKETNRYNLKFKCYGFTASAAPYVTQDTSVA
jgi:hypothetical protein